MLSNKQSKKIRIIPSILLKNSLTIRGKNFEPWRITGDIKQAVNLYSVREVDELFIMDIEAYKTKINFELIKDLSKNIFMPFVYGGGIKNFNDFKKCLSFGADRVSINSAAILNPGLIKEIVKKNGSQSLVISIDYNDKMEIIINSGKKNTKIKLIYFIKEIINKCQPGELLLTSISNDGMMKGYDIKNLIKISKISKIPIIAAGGAGKKEDFTNLINKTGITSFSGSSIFHFTRETPVTIKEYLESKSYLCRR